MIDVCHLNLQITKVTVTNEDLVIHFLGLEKLHQQLSAVVPALCLLLSSLVKIEDVGVVPPVSHDEVLSNLCEVVSDKSPTLSLDGVCEPHPLPIFLDA